MINVKTSTSPKNDNLKMKSLIIKLLPLLFVSSLIQACSNAKSDSNITKTITPPVESQTTVVDCNQGDKLAEVMATAKAGNTYMISGRCHETIVISQDHIELIGQSDAVIDGQNIDAKAVITIDVLRNIKISNLIIENGTDQGIAISRSSAIELNDLTIRHHTTVGISIDRSTTDLNNISLNNNGYSGLDAFTASNVVARGNINAEQNNGDGIAINGKSFLELRGAQVTTNDNNGSGITIINDSRLQIFSFVQAQGSTITSDNNGFAGIGLMDSSLGIVGAQFFGSGANEITATNNNIGLFMPAGAILSPHGTAKFTIKQNNLGMLLEDGASTLIVGGVDIQQNANGIAAKGAGTIHMVSVPPNPSVINNNDLDMALAFGSRAILTDVTITSINCDQTVLLEASINCPIP